MWRDNKWETQRRYVVPGGSVQINRARAAKAHMGAWFEDKVLSFPAFAQKVANPRTRFAELNVSGMIPQGLQCQPFEWYLKRFGHIYADGGVLPRRIFQLATTAADGSQRCLQLQGHHDWGNAAAPTDRLMMVACAETQLPNSRQWWHEANRLPSGRCCSGLRAWNSDQCLVSLNGDELRTTTCALEGQVSQFAALGDSGLLHMGQRGQTSKSFYYGGASDINGGASDRCAIVTSDAPKSALLGYYTNTRAYTSDAPEKPLNVSVASCHDGATVWARRNEAEPPEFALLSAASRATWPEPKGLPASAPLGASISREDSRGESAAGAASVAGGWDALRWLPALLVLLAALRASRARLVGMLRRLHVYVWRCCLRSALRVVDAAA